MNDGQMEIKDDFSLLLEYLAMLFAVRRLNEVDIQGYMLSYKGVTMINGSGESESDDFPQRDQLDRVKNLRIEVDPGRSGSRFSVEVSWDHVSGNFTDIRDFRRFVDLLDSSTFRYF